MKRNIIILLFISVIILVFLVISAGVEHRYRFEHKKLNNLVAKEKYLKLILTNNKYSGYLTIKKHYEEKLMQFADKHKNNKFVLALADKEKAEIDYYKK